MPSIEELYTFYKNNMIPSLIPLEKERKIIVRKFFSYLTITIASSILFVGLLLFLFSIEKGIIYSIISVLFIINLFTIGITYETISRRYKKKFNVDIIQKLIHFIDPTLTYEKYKSINLYSFEESNIFLKHVDEHEGSDLIYGKIGETKIEFSNLHTQYESKIKSRDGGTETTLNTIFSGIFFVADFNKNFITSLVILPDRVEKRFGKLWGSRIQSWNKKRGKLIKLENPEFEKYFVVYGEDQIESRYILSPDLMERIVSFRKKIKKNIYLSFVNNKVFIAISTQNLFAARIFLNLLQFKTIEKYYSSLRIGIDLVEDFNLNTRIWK